MWNVGDTSPDPFSYWNAILCAGLNVWCCEVSSLLSFFVTDKNPQVSANFGIHFFPCSDQALPLNWMSGFDSLSLKLRTIKIKIDEECILYSNLRSTVHSIIHRSNNSQWKRTLKISFKSSPTFLSKDQDVAWHSPFCFQHSLLLRHLLIFFKHYGKKKILKRSLKGQM